MSTLFADFKFAWRLLRRAPGYATIAILVLALGIGATTAMYGVLKTVVLNPLPFPDQHELVRVRESKPPEYPQFSVAPGNFLSWRGEVAALEAMSMFASEAYNLTGRDEPARLRGIQVADIVDVIFPLVIVVREPVAVAGADVTGDAAAVR